MRTGRWSELSAEHEVRYTGRERFLVVTMSKTPGVAERLYGLEFGGSGSKIVQEGFPGFVLIREFQSTCLELRSSAITTGNPPPKEAVRSTPISGQEDERYAARIVTYYYDLNGISLQVG